MNPVNQAKNIGFVYFMTERDLFGYPCGPYVKIGRVKGNEDGRSSFQRRNEHQTGNPREIIVEEEIKTQASESTLESLVHQRLAKFRIHGEWFNYGEKGILPYVELTRKINRDLESQLENDLKIINFSGIEDNGEDISPSSEAEDVYNELLKIKAEFVKVKGEKDLAALRLRSFNKEFCKDIDGICSYEKIKPSEKLETVIFKKDHPDIFEKLCTKKVKGTLLLKKDVKQTLSREFKDIQETIKVQQFLDNSSSRLIKRDELAMKLHEEYLEAHVSLQPIEYKRKLFENKLKLLTAENQGIKKICTWKRRISKQLNKNDLLNYDPELTQKYITKKKSVIRFKINDYRPYPF